MMSPLFRMKEEKSIGVIQADQMVVDLPAEKEQPMEFLINDTT